MKVENDSALFQELSRALLADGKVVRFRAQGRSMFPEIRDGDWVEVETVDDDQLKINDVIVFRSAEGICVHRLVKRERDRLVTCGDSSLECDQPIGFEQVMGRVVRVERPSSGSRIRRWLRGQLWYRRVRTWAKAVIVR